MTAHFEKMDRNYRYQRLVYDSTRKYFLLGRDKLLQKMHFPDHAHLLEVGCGTGRNLRLLAKTYPQVSLYGLDASELMLNTAARKSQSLLNKKRLVFKKGLAEDINYSQMFGLERPFDAIFFSYSLSMISHWQTALDQAWVNLQPGGSLYIVDFFDQHDLPSWFSKTLNQFLSYFHVKFDPEFINYFRNLESSEQAILNLQSLYGGYSFIASLKKND